MKFIEAHSLSLSILSLILSIILFSMSLFKDTIKNKSGYIITAIVLFGMSTLATFFQTEVSSKQQDTIDIKTSRISYLSDSILRINNISSNKINTIDSLLRSLHNLTIRYDALGNILIEKLSNTTKVIIAHHEGTSAIVYDDFFKLPVTQISTSNQSYIIGDFTQNTKKGYIEFTNGVLLYNGQVLRAQR